MSDLPAIEVRERVRRVFVLNGAELADPNPKMAPDEVRKMYGSSGYPALTNGSVTGPVRENGRDVYTLKGAVGTKG